MDNYIFLHGKKINIKTMLQVAKLDEEAFGKKYSLSLIKALFWFLINRHGYTIIIDRNTKKVVSYLSVVALKKKYYDIIKSGNQIDVLLPLNAFVIPSKKHLNYGYLSSIVIKREYQSPSLAIKLIDEAYNYFIRMYDKNIYYSSVLFDVVSNKGNKLATMFDLSFIKESNHNSIIYEVSLIPPTFKKVLKNGVNLFELYSSLNNNK